MRRLYFYSLILLTVQSFVWSQLSDPTLRRIGYHTGNRIGISFYNDGQIAGFNTGVDIRGEWPLGSGYNYIGDLIPMIGVEFLKSDNQMGHSVCISRGPRTGQDRERSQKGYFWGWNPEPGYLNPNQTSIAMSYNSKSWPLGGWADHPDWVDPNGNTQWNGYFGRGITNADQESYFVADDQWDDEFTPYYSPIPSDSSRHGMGLKMAVRGFQWSSFLAEDAIFWLYDITNDAAKTYRKSVFGTVVGTLAGGDGDSQDDLGFFDINDNITYSWDSDNKGNKGQKVGYVAYAFLESPGNPFDGIDNDGDSQDPNSPMFTTADFDSVSYPVGKQIVLIDSITYERSLYTIKGPIDTVYSLGVRFIIRAGVTKFREGNIARIDNGVSVPDASAYDGFDNDLDGVIDENQAVHYETRQRRGFPVLKYINYVTGAGVNDLLIDEKRDNDAGTIVTSWVKSPDGIPVLASHWSGDEDGDWDAQYDDVGADGVGPNDNDYFGPDADGTEGNGRPDQGEPNFGKTDPHESDQIGLTSFNFFNIAASPDMSNDELLWDRMTPGRFDIISSQPQDGDFIYSSGYFPMRPKQIERFSVALLFGETYADVVRNKKIVQQIYNAGYKFPQPPRKPKLNITQENGNVVLYWDGSLTENSRDFITKKKDFQGYKIYRATDAGFQDSRSITDGFGVLSFDKPIAQFDLIDSIENFFVPSGDLLEAVGGTSYWLGSNTGIVNKYIDTTAIPGQRYFYAVVSYDRGDASLNIFPSENSKYVFITNAGEIITDDNTGHITPSKPPIGYNNAIPSVLQKEPDFHGTGEAWVEIVDDKQVRDKNQYSIIFSDSAAQGYTTDWSLIDRSAIDTLYISSENETKYVSPTDTISIPSGEEIVVNGKSFISDTNIYSGSYDTLVDKSTVFYGSTPIKHGFKIQILNDNFIEKDSVNSFYQDISSATPPTYLFAPFVWATSGIGMSYNGIKMPYDYKIEFYPDSTADTSLADTLYPATNRITAKNVNFKVKNLTTGKYIDFVYFKNLQLLSTIHNIYFKEMIGGKLTRTWRINIYYNFPNAPLETSGFLQISTFKPFSRTDIYDFTMQGAHININQAKSELDKIKVVPNPYVVTHEAEPKLLSTQSSGRGERFIRFTHVPPGSTISIYTVRGELVKKIRHDDIFSGDVKWNLRTEENLDAAYGVYVYVLEAENIGTKTGKFALIK
ncbi:MAG: hypothetical protein HY964_09570 [Ignavibacteriales bacterium]|nr:hypothetical protein [Ignavibacteriales bacterium]